MLNYQRRDKSNRVAVGLFSRRCYQFKKSFLKKNEGIWYLHILAEEGRDECITDWLLGSYEMEEVVPMNHLSSDDKTPLHFAAKNGHLDVVKLLVEKGANLEADSYRHGVRPIHCSLYSNNPECLRYIVEKILQLGLNIDMGDKRHDTALHYAALCHKVTEARILLDNGANPNAMDLKSRTPLFCALKTHYTLEMTRLLLGKGADLSIADTKDRLPIHYTASKPLYEELKLIINETSDLDIRDRFLKRTALHYAAEYGHIFNVQLLLDSGASVDPLDIHRATPLHLASKRKHMDVVEFLLEKGADSG